MSIKVKIIIIICFTISMVILTKVTGIDKMFNLESIKTLILGSGIKGILIYIALFTIGSFMSIPGMLFIVVAFVVYGSFYGSIVAYFGALVAVTMNFLIVRKFGGSGSGLEDVKKPWLQKWLTRLEANPFRAMVTIRAIFWISPPLNFTLALTPLGSKNYILGTAIGLFVPMTILTTASYLWMDELIRLIS